MLSIVLASTMAADAAWVIKLIRSLFFPDLDYRFIVWFIRISWGFCVIQYQAMSLFIESLIRRDNLFGTRQKTLSFISFGIALFFLSIAFVYFNVTDPSLRTFEFYLEKLWVGYALFPVMLSTILIVLQKLYTGNLPQILSKQLKILFAVIIIPIWISDFLQVFPFGIIPGSWTYSSHLPFAISNILLTYALYYCTRKLVGLRFLNFENHVQANSKFNFMDDFKAILEQFSHVSDLKELGHITQNFFKEALEIPLSKTRLYIRKRQADKEEESRQMISEEIPALVETFMNTHTNDVCSYMKKNKILIYDEIVFTNFYEQTTERDAIIAFMDAINAGVFLPIYEKDKLVAYITIERFARNNQFYSDIERDEMLVFASYLGNIINLIQNKSLDLLVQQEKELREELYRKHQEINQYKESIRSFVRTNKQKEIGLIFYKNRRFTFGNQAAKEILQINPNTQEGHPITKTLKKMVHIVEDYNRQQTEFAKDAEGRTIILSAVPDLEQRNVIVSVYYPDMSDVLRRHLDLLKDPSEWDYLLYLETTQSGKLINQLIPGSGERLLTFKIDLLKIALSKKAILIDMPEEDLHSTVELLHHISLRERLHILELTENSNSVDIAIKLFGINPIFGMKDPEKPLFERLSENGTLFIQNIHFLNKEVQEYLAEYLKFGHYRVFKSDQRMQSNVRIICSTVHNLAHMAQENHFSQNLFNELKQTTVCMPSLITLPESELSELAEGFSEQVLKTQTFKNLLELTPRDKDKLINMRPASLQELKNKVQGLLVQKSKKNEIYHETYFDPAYQVTDPELVEAARLGKHALKDRKLLTLLWDKFGNQNKIATFLGVNRSSVNRRCKEFKLD